MNNYKLKEKIIDAANNILQGKNYISPVDILIAIEVLTRKDYENWRFGRITYLERVCKTNLSKLSFINKELRLYALKNNLKPSWTAYNQWAVKGKKLPLRFSKSGLSNIEKVYATHYFRASAHIADNEHLDKYIQEVK